MEEKLLIDSIEALYKAIDGHDELRAKALLILTLRSWLTGVSGFDPVTGHALPTGIVNFMNGVTRKTENIAFEVEIKDRIYRIANHTKEAIQAILEHPRDKILREHAMLPIHAAREIDNISVQWLSRQPGRNFREKLSGKPYIKAVQRRSSVDTSENRLLKAFLLRFEHILIERQSALNAASEETCEELLALLQRWLRCEDAVDIGYWGNLPPNNTLLQDKRYRKVWDAWLWLQNLDENIEADNKRMHQDILSVIYWKTLSMLNNTGLFRTIQQPLDLNYDNFTITTSLSVNGYLFPTDDPKITGKIKNINYEKKFGFLTADSGTDLFFHKSNLSRELGIDSLKAGDAVSFEIGRNRQGECADNIHIVTGPEAVNLKLSHNRIDISLGKKEALIQIDSEHIVLIQKPKGTKKKFEQKLSAFDDVSGAIWSLLTDDPFHPFAIKDSQKDLTRTDMSVVDLCSIRPRLTSDEGSQVLLPFRLLQQHWPVNANDGVAVDCGETKAIVLRSDIETISMRSIFSPNSTLSEAVKSNASMFFIKKLKDYIPADRLSYLVPDWGNDFDLECIRKSVNFYFEESTPLPKSIAAIFAWHSSQRFEQDKVRENDFVLVVDAFDGGISITPVQAIYPKELNEILPESKGISWERHPTFIAGNKDIHTGMVRNLSQDGCQISDELIQLFGFDGFVNDAGSLSFVNNDDWYHLPDSIRKILNQNLDENALSSQTIRNCLSSTNRDYRGVTVFILPLEDTIKKPELGRHCNWLGSDWSPIKGCQILKQWQKEAAEIALWRDHLPKLSFKDIPQQITKKCFWWADFELVKDATVTPQRGRTVSIPVKESFTLPAGQPHYSFPLQQGEGNQELQFVAYLKSPAFPLKEATTCKLQMTYTYGADDPYELKFIPLDAGCSEFKSIHVEWRSVAENTMIDLENLPVPVFPARKTWSDFQKFPKENGSDFSDLLDWVKRDLAKLNDIAKYGRIKAPITKWIDKGNDNVFCFLEDTFIHRSMLNLRNNKEIPQSDECISFYKIERQDGKFTGADVCIGDSNPKSCFLTKSLRFPVLTIWNNGHSLTESDVPDYFKNSVFNGTNCALSIIQSENMPDSLKEELFFFLSCLHKDAPGIVGTRLVEAVTDKKRLRNYNRNIAFAIGDAELPWQKELLANVINPIDNEGLTRSITMEILAIAFWRSKELISILTESELEVLSHNLYGCLEVDFQKVAKGGGGYQVATLCKHLELLLSLLRVRGDEDERKKILLAPDKELSKRYVTLVDDISKEVINNDIEIRSRISLQIKIPKMFRNTSNTNTPDLLYALRMYLTGDSRANTIVITGISDDD